MATLEDKILGEKLHNYCSSSEESDNDENSDSEKSNKHKGPSKEEPVSLPEVNKWEGTSLNTGPKGVIEDWKKFKQLEDEKREDSERLKIELAKKLTLTVKTALEEEREKAAMEDPELAELLNDDFLLAYQKKRMEEMLEQTNHNIKFGQLTILKDSQDFLDAIDKENPTVKVIVHIYDDSIEACRSMNKCLQTLARVYDNVKFCAIHGTKAGVSRHFKVDGVPALLVYKSGSLVGNFVKMSDDLGTKFEPEDVQSFLVEHGLLEDKNCTPLLVKSGANADDSDDD